MFLRVAFQGILLMLIGGNELLLPPNSIPGFPSKGLFSSPRNNFPVMHKAENKYEVGKVSDDQQLKQRQIKAMFGGLFLWD
jgi:hypothetical protein